MLPPISPAIPDLCNHFPAPQATFLSPISPGIPDLCSSSLQNHFPSLHPTSHSWPVWACLIERGFCHHCHETSSKPPVLEAHCAPSLLSSTRNSSPNSAKVINPGLTAPTGSISRKSIRLISCTASVHSVLWLAQFPNQDQALPCAVFFEVQWDVIKRQHKLLFS